MFFTFTLFFLFLIKKSNIEKNFRYYFFYGWLFGFGYFLSNLYWISISLTFDQNFKFLIPFTIILIPAFLALFYGLTFYLCSILLPKKNNKFIFIIFINFWNFRIYQRLNINRFSLEFDILQFCKSIRIFKYNFCFRNLWI